MNNPYERCPTLETAHFALRLVSDADAVDLLSCYSDPQAQRFFNADRCSGDFCMHAIEDMKACIEAWLHAYAQQDYIRFSIVDKVHSKAVGTIEMFGYKGKYKVKTGILRVDVASSYENEACLNELFQVCNTHFFDLFEVDTIATKAIPLAVERRRVLAGLDFREGKVYEGEHYFLSTK